MKEVIGEETPVVIPKETLTTGNASMGSVQMKVDTSIIETVPGLIAPIDHHFLVLASHSTNLFITNGRFFALNFHPIGLESSLILGKHTGDQVLLFDFNAMAVFDAWVANGSIGTPPPTPLAGNFDASNLTIDIQGIRQAVSSRKEDCPDPTNPNAVITKTIVTDHIDVVISGFIPDPISTQNIPFSATLVSLRERIL